MLPPSQNVPELLSALANGDDSAVNQLFPLVYEQLHHLASHYLAKERPDHTLQPTALIHEAFLRMVKPKGEKFDADSDLKPYNNVEHFMATAAIVMRQILVNHAKAKKTQKRGGDRNQVYLEEISSAFENRSVDLVDLDEAMKQLEKLDTVQHRLIELRFFGGMTFEQCATYLKMSERSVYYEWAHARAWLKSQLED